MTAPTMTVHPTLSALRGATLVMEAAHAAGLPIPRHVTVSSYGAVTYELPTEVWWLPETLDDLHAWADYLSAPVTSHPVGNTVYHNVDAALFDQRVRLCVIEDAS